MKTKYVCHGVINPHVNFYDNRTMKTVILIIKTCRWGGGGGEEEKEPTLSPKLAFWQLR